MKSASEILEMLVKELEVRIASGSWAKKERGFYNQAFGDSSFLLAALLEALLKKNVREWVSEAKWLDDSLITHVKLSEDKLSLGGVMIWGDRVQPPNG